MCGQCVEWGGATWHRYGSGYYERSEKIEGRKRSYALHREVYRAEHGSIPAGMDVHHVDEDKTNNEPANLVALTRSEHRKLHEVEKCDWGAKQSFPIPCSSCGTILMRRKRVSAKCRPCQSRDAERARKSERECAHCGAKFRSRSGALCSQRCVNLATSGATRSVLPKRGGGA